jgi:shikimate kinase
LAEPHGAPRKHIVLVGLPGSGKSTVGRIVAERLQRPFLDFDVEISRREGGTIVELFARHGEPWFRERERALTAELSRAEGMVLAPGGGWMTNPGCLEMMRDRSILFYLTVSVESAMTRMKAEPKSRPLLSRPDPREVMQGLLEARETTYLQSNHTVSTEMMSPPEVADTIVVLAGG